MTRRYLLKLLGAGAFVIGAGVFCREQLLARPRSAGEMRRPPQHAPPPRRPRLQSLEQPGEPPPGLAWRPANAAERKAATGVIQAQLEAFRRNEYSEAHRHLSSVLKREFADREAFRHLVQGLYPELAHFQSVQYGHARATQSGMRVEIAVSVTGRDGITTQAAYDLVREGNTFLIASIVGGVSHERPPDFA
jgi:hypothetical protein